MAKEKVISFDNLKEYDQKMKKWTQNKLDKLSSNDDDLSSKIKDLEKADKDILKEIKSLGKGNSNNYKKLSEFENDCNFITKNDIPTKLSELQNDLTQDVKYIQGVNADELCNMKELERNERIIDDVDFFNLMLEKYQKNSNQTLYIKTTYDWNSSVTLNLYDLNNNCHILNINGYSNIIIRGSKINPKSWRIIQFTIIVGKNNAPGTIPVNSIVNGTLAYDGKENLIRQLEIINKKKLSEFSNDCNFITKSELPTKLSELENDTKYLNKNDLPTKLSAFENDKGYITKDEIQTESNQNNSQIGTLILLPTCIERPDGFLPCDKDQNLNPEFLFGINYSDIPTEFINLSRKMAGDNFPMRGEIYLPNYEAPKGAIYYIKYK